MRYIVDIDGTICEHIDGPNFGSGEVYYDRIDMLNNLYDNGHEIIYMTARAWDRRQTQMVDLMNKLSTKLMPNMVNLQRISYYHGVANTPNCS